MPKEFGELVEQHRHWVYTHAYYSLGSCEEAEDATQEVLIRLWQHWHELKKESVGAWIRRVTRNACIDTLRKRRAYAARVVASGESETFVQAVSLEPEPDVQTENSELRTHIRQALATLAEPYRTIVIMREIQDMKYEQISDTVDLPLNTVKSYLYRGRRMLRDQLRDVVKHESI